VRRVRVRSSSIESVGYENDVLEVRFRNGGLYQYLDVPARLHELLLRAGSKGAFFNRHIRDRYPATRLERGSDAALR
jgi:hypothetical protein